MPFLQFPVYFVDEEEEDSRSNLRLPPRPSKGFISINTQQICSYNEMDNKHVLVRMSDGDCIEIPMVLKEFDKMLCQVEAIVNIQTNLTEN